MTTPFTFFSTAGCIARLGARPVFVDIDPETFNLSPASLDEFFATKCTFEEGKIRTRGGLQVKAVIPVHLFGACCAMDEIQAFARATLYPSLKMQPRRSVPNTLPKKGRSARVESRNMAI